MSIQLKGQVGNKTAHVTSNGQTLQSRPLLATSYVTKTVSSSGGSRILSSVSEETKILKEIQATHDIDARAFDITPVISVVEDILHRATLSTDATPGTKEVVADVLAETLGGVAAGPKGTMLEALSVVIQKVCCEFSCKCSGGDVHASTIQVLNMLGGYSWDAKVVITLAAFAVTYGELWLVILLGLANHPLAKSIAVLKQTPELGEINGVLKSQFATLNVLVKVVVDVSKSLTEFSSLPSKYITLEDAPLATSMNPIAIATYWSIRSIIACGARITSNIGITSGLVTSATEAWDLSSLTHKQKSLHEQLRQKLTICYEHIEIKKMEEAYANLVRVYQTPQKDNLGLLKAWIYPRDDIKPLVRVSPKRRNIFEVIVDKVADIINLPNDDDIVIERFHVDVLKGKTVLFFISDLDVSEEELAILDKIYKESKQKGKEIPYEIVWIPVVDQMTKELERKFKELQYRMSWYTLFHPSILDVVSKRFIKEHLGFVKKQIIVSIDPVGKETTRNALQLLFVWGNSAYPFTKVVEEELWKKETWRGDFLLSSVLPDYNKWAAQPNTHVCFFGGEDIEWIRKFVTSIKEQITKTGTKMELVYIGKPNAKKAVERIIEIIKKEKIAHTLPNVTTVTYFWTRIESMLYTRSQHVPHDKVDNDIVIKQIMSVLSLGSGHDGWASITKPGTTEIVQGKGDHFLNIISKPEFSQKITKEGFVSSLSKEIVTVSAHTGFHCNRVEFPSIEGAGVPRRVVCTDCQRPMEKYILYKCCSG